MHLSDPPDRRSPGRLASAEGFTMIAVLGVLMTLMALSVAAFAAAGGDIHAGRHDQDEKKAYAAAEAGVQNYMFHLNEDNGYWAKCTGVPGPSAVNQAWDGTGTDTRTKTLAVPGTDTTYAIELLPATGNASNPTTCDPANAEGTMIDDGTKPDSNAGSFRIRSTGFSRGVKRSIVTSFRRRGFLDYLYFTDKETTDPAWYQKDTRGRATFSCKDLANPADPNGTDWCPEVSGQPQPPFLGPDLVTWGSAKCDRYWRDGRGTQSYRGYITWFDDNPYRWGDVCNEIQFANLDRIQGPLHTNDEILVCGSPTFGRTAQDKIEVSGAGWRGNCGGDNPTFVGTWTPNAPVLTLPPSDSELKQVVDPAYLFTGKTKIVLNGNSMTVNGSPVAFPSNGVVYVQNGVCGRGYVATDPYNDPDGCADVTVDGSYSTPLTIATEKDIIIDGSVLRSNNAMLGLIANGFVRVYHPVDRPNQDPTACQDSANPPQINSLEIDAAILSLAHSFTVDNYYCGNPLGTLTVNGTIGQKYRGPVGTGGAGGIATGYIKNYLYDDRLRYRSPPHFIDPVQAAWRIQRYVEQSPAR